VDRAHIQPLELADLRGFERPDRDAPECLKVLPGDQESSRGSRILAREVNQLIGEALKREIQIQGAGIFAKEEAHNFDVFRCRRFANGHSCRPPLKHKTSSIPGDGEGFQ
jgi:hypothetical protein